MSLGATAGAEAPADTIHDRLRRHTDPHHRAAERAFAGFDLRTRPGYAGFLAAQATAVIATEEAATQGGIAALLPDWPRRTRAAAIRADLERLGVAPAELPAAYGAGVDPLGLAYVLEGSRHGAALLVRRVLSSGDPALAAATGFLCEPVDRERWGALVLVLNGCRDTDAGWLALTSSAVSAFGLFRRSALAVLGAAAGPGGAADRRAWKRPRD